MDGKIQSIGAVFKERFGAELQESHGETSAIIGPEHIVAAARALRDEFGFELLTEETAVDYWPQLEPRTGLAGARFHIVTLFRCLGDNLIFGIRVPLNGNAPTMPSLVEVYANANWFERELWDMFGIRFEGHPDLRRLVMPYDWEGHPLRKDYPLGYEEVQFSFNFDEIDLRKPYAQE
jgi:NADH-quinone oxidoreductase subunit C